MAAGSPGRQTMVQGVVAGTALVLLGSALVVADPGRTAGLRTPPAARQVAAGAGAPLTAARDAAVPAGLLDAERTQAPAAAAAQPDPRPPAPPEPPPPAAGPDRQDQQNKHAGQGAATAATASPPPAHAGTSPQPQPQGPAPQPQSPQPQSPQPQSPQSPPSPRPQSEQGADPGTARQEAPPSEDSAAVFAREFPAQHAARASHDHPGGNSWAVIVGIDDYAGRTRDNIGSAGDAGLLTDLLARHGWLGDHVVLLRDRDATHDRIVRALEWLIRSTDEHSTVVVSYSGHTRQNRGGSDPDGDGEGTDEGLWAADNRILWDADFARILGAVRARSMWITVQACEAAGFGDPGLERPGRLLTYSSREDEKSHEDPEVGLSLQGRYLFGEALRDGLGDHNGDGWVSVQEAYNWATPRTHARAAGRQTPVAVDGLAGQPFDLAVRR